MVFHFRSEHPEWLHGLDQNEAVRTMKERLQRLAKLCESHIAVPVQKRLPRPFSVLVAAFLPALSPIQSSGGRVTQAGKHDAEMLYLRSAIS